MSESTQQSSPTKVVKDEITLLKKKGLNVNAPDYSCGKFVPVRSVSQFDSGNLDLSDLRIHDESLASDSTFTESFNKLALPLIKISLKYYIFTDRQVTS
jgi:hypothetical protein